MTAKCDRCYRWMAATADEWEVSLKNTPGKFALLCGNWAEDVSWDAGDECDDVRDLWQQAEIARLTGELAVARETIAKVRVACTPGMQHTPGDKAAETQNWINMIRAEISALLPPKEVKDVG